MIRRCVSLGSVDVLEYEYGDDEESEPNAYEDHGDREGGDMWVVRNGSHGVWLGLRVEGFDASYLSYEVRLRKF